MAAIGHIGVFGFGYLSGQVGMLHRTLVEERRRRI
jgi:chromate transport protein ChrA